MSFFWHRHDMTVEEIKDFIKLTMKVVLSAAIVVFCMILIYYSPDDNYKKWATGMIGVIIGYWLK